MPPKPSPPADPAPFDPVSREEDGGLDLALRPRNFEGFVGQARTVDNLKVAVEAARQRGEPLDHVLLSGLPGLGKTTLACLLAREMGSDLRLTSGPALGKAADLAGLLTNLRKGDVLFVDEVHRLHPVVEEYLYSAMEDYAIDIVIDSGPSARSVRVTLQPFTLVGATTREGLLSAPFRSRFGITEKLEPYPPEDLEEVVRRSAAMLSVEIEAGATALLASRSRGTPRVANRFLKRVRDLAQLVAKNRISVAVAEDAMARLGVDRNGLSAVDRSLLLGLARSGGGPVGLKTLALLVGEEQDTVEDVIEPFLIREGYLDRTPRGRRLTDRGFAAVGERPPAPGAEPG
ncbi:MAG: Holliday junction branch migration DNA helicase RuvB, partial [Planctomycetaceae bacterium]|nr:Holliday junction branch migration DNA helicase RuvB [Planctomycetaceae bacterium]